jgi:hypothetical protein
MRTRVLLRIALAVLIALLAGTVLIYTTFFVSAQDTRIRYGETLEGSIANAGETDTWTFDGLRGDVVTIQATRTDGNLIPVVSLVDPDKIILISLDWPQDGPPQLVFTVTLRTSGTHSLSVASDNNTTGSYTLSLELQQAGAAADQDGLLIYGRAATGEISDETFRQVWSFRGAQNDVVDVVMTTTSGNLKGSLALLAPEGDVVASVDSGDTNQDVAVYAVRLPSTGTYTLVARRSGSNAGAGGDTWGTYELAITLRVSGTGSANATPATLVIGTPMRGRLSSNAPTALFRVETQGVLCLALNFTDPAQMGIVSVMTPERGLLGVYSAFTPLHTSVAIPSEGVPLIEVSTEGLAPGAIVDFSLMAYPLATATTGSRGLLYNEFYVVSNETALSDAWYFVGQAGDLVNIYLTPFVPTLDGRLRVLSPNGVQLVQRPIREAAVQPLILSETGPYEVFVEGVSGTYRIGVEQQGMLGLAFEQRRVPMLRGFIQAGTANAVSGELSAGSSEAWEIDIVEAQAWSFDLAHPASDLPIAWAVESPEGETLAVAVTHRLTRSGSAQVQIPQAGRYRIVVFDPTSTATTSAYTLSGQPVEGGTLWSGATVKGELTATARHDRWMIDVLPGAVLDVQLSPIVPGRRPVVYVMEPDGQLIASSQWSEQTGTVRVARVQMVEGGNAQIVIVQSAGFERLTYHLTVQASMPLTETFTQRTATAPVSEVLVTQTTPEIMTRRVSSDDLLAPSIPAEAEFLARAHEASFGALLRGEIAPGQFFEAWVFSANAGQMLEFSAIAVTDASGPDLILLDRNAAILAEKYRVDTKTNTLTYRFDNGGNYTLVVKLDEGGPYTLWMQSLSGLDETVPVVLSGRAIAYGDTIEGEYSANGGTAEYVFFGQEGDLLTIGVRELYGDGSPEIEIVSSGGETLSTSEINPVPLIANITNFRVPSDGLYQIRVRANDPTDEHGGHFMLYLGLERLTVLEEYSGGVLKDRAVAGLGVENILRQQWLFNGQVGETITVQAEPLFPEGPLPFVLQLADSAGNVFLQREAVLGRGALILRNVLLPRSGVYQVIISGGQRSAGFYSVSLERSAGAFSADQALRYGETAGQVLTPQNGLDVWTLAGSQGDVVTLSARLVRGDAAPISIQLRTQNGLVLATGTSSGAVGARIEAVELPITGHYSVIVGNLDSAFQGEAVYEITARLGDASAHSMGTVIAYGQTVEGTFYVDDPSDVWLFEGRQGDQVTITAGGLRAGLMPSLSLISTDWRAASQLGQAEVLATTQAVEGQPARIEFALPSDGPYALVVRDPSIVGGVYQLNLAGPVTPVSVSETIRPGRPREGQIASLDSFDMWSFEAAAGDVVTITLRPESRSTLSPMLRLLDPTARVLAETSAAPLNTARINTYTLSLAGAYTIVVARELGVSGVTEGRYTLDLSLAPADLAGVVSTAYGRLERGRLDAEISQNRWSFLGAQGDVVRVYADATSDDLDLMLRLFDVNGHLVGQSDDVRGLGAELYARLSLDSLYYVDVLRYGGLAGATQGNYILGVERVYQTGISEASRRLIYGDRVNGSTNNRSRSDQWIFAGQQGDRVYVRIQFPTDDTPLALLVRDLAGNTLATGERDRGDAVIEAFTLPVRGEYVIEVRRPEDAVAAHSPYTLDLALVGALALPPSEGGMITPGQAVVGQFNTIPDTHAWLFQGTSGDRIVVECQPLNHTEGLAVTLLGPGGQVLASRTESLLSATLRADGIYTILVSGDVQPGAAYRLSLPIIDQTSVPPLLLVPLLDVFGEITDVHPTEQWQFDAQAGEVIFLRAAAISGDLTPILMLWGPDGRPIQEGVRDDTSGGAQSYLIIASAPGTGTYTISVGRAGYQTGRYRLMLRNANLSEHAARATDIAFGQQLSGLVHEAAPQSYAFQGLAGDIVAVSARVIDSEASLTLSVETEEGTSISVSSAFAAEDEVGLSAFVLPETGRYVINVTSVETARYVFTAFRRAGTLLPDVQGRELGRSTNFAGEITDSVQPAYWFFEGRAGETLIFSANTSASRLQADMTLYGSRGYMANAIQAAGSNATTLGPIRLPEDGTYWLVIGAWRGAASSDTVGSYTVRIDSAESSVSGSEGGLLVQGQTVSGGLIPDDAQDIWVFEGRAGEIVTITAEPTRGDASLVLELWGSSGDAPLAVNPVGSGAIPLIGSFALPETGRYRVFVKGSFTTNQLSIEYWLTMRKTRVPIVADLREAQSLSYGEPQVGVLMSADSHQAWVFYGQAGESIRLEVRPTADTFIPVVYLLDSTGAVMRAETGQVAGGAVQFAGVMLPSWGFYGVVVGGKFLDTTVTHMGYEIILDQAIAGEQWQGIWAEGTAARLTSGAPVHEWLFVPDYPGDYTVLATASGPGMDVFVFTSAGRNIAVGTNDEFGSASASFYAAQGGRYSIIVSDSTVMASKLYHLAIFPSSVVTGGREIPGNEANVGRIDSEHLADEWQIEARAGDTLSFSVNRVTGDLIFSVMIFDRNGVQIGAFYGDASGIIAETITTPSDGLYHMVVSRTNDSLTAGEYTVAVSVG